MSMSEDTAGEKTLPASPLKKERAREKGQVAKSQDLNSAAALAAALGALYVLGPVMGERLRELSQFFFTSASDLALERGSVGTLALATMGQLARVALPFMGVMLAAGVAINLAQFGFLMSANALTPQLNRVNPVAGMARFFSVRSLVELTKSLFKIALIGLVVYFTLRTRWGELMMMSYVTPLGAVQTIGDITLLIWFRVVLVMLALGLLDYAYQRWQWEQDLRMTVQEMREEMRQLEGDPHVRQRVRQIQRQMAMQRMMAEVPAADVVVTNPTTYAVALRYDLRGMDAPMVTAKGARLMAERIRAIAEDNRVPIVEKPELARTLYRTVELDQAVPESMYRAVAEVMRYVYEVDRRAEKVRERAAFLAETRQAAG
jgi:flagellar biosynthetic protein FlhB